MTRARVNKSERTQRTAEEQAFSMAKKVDNRPKGVVGRKLDQVHGIWVSLRFLILRL